MSSEWSKRSKRERTQQSHANMSSPAATSSAVSPRQRWLCSPSLWSPTWRERLYEKLQQSRVLQAPAKYFSGRSITTVTWSYCVLCGSYLVVQVCLDTQKSRWINMFRSTCMTGVCPLGNLTYGMVAPTGTGFQWILAWWGYPSLSLPLLHREGHWQTQITLSHTHTNRQINTHSFVFLTL